MFTAISQFKSDFPIRFLSITFSILRHVSCSPSNAISSRPSRQKFQSVPVRVAHRLLQAGHRYLDVRTEEEFRAGHVPKAANIPYMFTADSGMVKNPKFLEQVSLDFAKDDNIVVGCRSGKRSLMAANDLLDAGYISVTDVAGGYLAWTQEGLEAES